MIKLINRAVFLITISRNEEGVGKLSDASPGEMGGASVAFNNSWQNFEEN